MKMKVPLKFQLLLLATFTLYACESTQDLETTLIPEANKKAHQKTLANAKRCALTLSSLTDNRTSKTLVLHETNNESLSDPDQRQDPHPHPQPHPKPSNCQYPQ